MAHITNKLRGLVAAFVAVFAALALVPGTAFADYANPRGGVIEVSNVTAGDTVTIYKVVDYNYNETQNTVSWEFVNGIESISGIPHDTYRDEEDPETIRGYADLMAAFVLGGSYTGTEESGDVYSQDVVNTSVTFGSVDAPLDDGEYLIIVQPGNGTTKIYQHAIAKLEPVQNAETNDWAVNEGKWTVDMQLKSADEPYPDKDIDSESATSSSDYAVGDPVPFKITSAIPLYPENAVEETFNISDTMNHLAFNSGSLVVTVNTSDGTELAKLQQGADYTLEVPGDEGETFRIEFVYDNIREYAGNVVTVKYTATVQDSAEHISYNTATVEFTRNPMTAGNYDENPGETVEVYTYEVQVNKQDVDTKDALEGAEFGLYTDEAGSNQVMVNGSHVTFTTDGNGYAEISGLKAGTYYLIETKAPEGYQLDKTPHKVVITAVADSDGQFEYSYTIDNQKQDISLPVTGGAGTVALTAAGVVLVAGAAAFIVRSRKEN